MKTFTKIAYRKLSECIQQKDFKSIHVDSGTSPMAVVEFENNQCHVDVFGRVTWIKTENQSPKPPKI
jgi:hypothetical protein